MINYPDKEELRQYRGKVVDEFNDNISITMKKAEEDGMPVNVILYSLLGRWAVHYDQELRDFLIKTDLDLLEYMNVLIKVMLADNIKE